jgi:lysyl-tRNA synthetase class 2
MSIISEKIEGKVISVEINSSNLKSAVYNTEDKKLTITFKNGSLYEYNEVPWDVFAALRVAKSQGSFFSKNISRKYDYKKIN